MNDNQDKNKLSWDNSRYSKDISQELLNKYTSQEYEETAKKMDIHLLHTISEQRCRPFGCRLQNCLQKFNDLNQCLTLYRQMNYCVEVERKKVIYEFIETNRQPKT
jgi:hypothetical protein